MAGASLFHVWFCLHDVCAEGTRFSPCLSEPSSNPGTAVLRGRPTGHPNPLCPCPRGWKQAGRLSSHAPACWPPRPPILGPLPRLGHCSLKPWSPGSLVHVWCSSAAASSNSDTPVSQPVSPRPRPSCLVMTRVPEPAAAQLCDNSHATPQVPPRTMQPSPLTDRGAVTLLTCEHTYHSAHIPHVHTHHTCPLIPHTYHTHTHHKCA